ncbi:MAG: hypothetical protein OXT67_03375 [Zetaproteobacteria bacterium]|nr:hypothetical protein [Zetaproteobacteria bacterium]
MSDGCRYLVQTFKEHNIGDIIHLKGKTTSRLLNTYSLHTTTQQQPSLLPSWIQNLKVHSTLQPWIGAMLTGNINLLPPQSFEKIAEVGVLHLFILSGWHLSGLFF